MRLFVAAAILLVSGCDSVDSVADVETASLRALPDPVMLDTPLGPQPALRFSLENEGTVTLDQINVRLETRRSNGGGTSGTTRVGVLAPGARTTATALLSAASHEDYECYSYAIEYLYVAKDGGLERSGQTEGGTCDVSARR